MKISDFQRKKLNLEIVPDISGSIKNSFDSCYYDEVGNGLFQYNKYLIYPYTDIDTGIWH